MLNRRQMILRTMTATATASLMSGLARAADKIAIDDKSVLLVIDVQNCFLPGGSLAVKDGDQVVPVINRIARSFANVAMSPSRPATAAGSRSRRSTSATASRCSGPITACRAPTARRCRRT